MSKELIELDKFLGECPAHKKLPWKIGAMESGRVAIDSDDDKEVTGWIDPEDAFLILNQQQRIEELERENNELAARIGKELNEETMALQADNARLREALENCRLLAARHRKEEWAGHVLRLCESAGVAATALRSPK